MCINRLEIIAGNRRLNVLYNGRSFVRNHVLLNRPSHEPHPRFEFQHVVRWSRLQGRHGAGYITVQPDPSSYFNRVNLSMCQTGNFVRSAAAMAKFRGSCADVPASCNSNCLATTGIAIDDPHSIAAFLPCPCIDRTAHRRRCNFCKSCCSTELEDSQSSSSQSGLAHAPGWHCDGLAL